jgi:hypothetical protein
VRKAHAGWVTRSLYLEDATHRRLEIAAGESSGTGDLVLRPVKVSGHLKRHRFGAGNRQVKWIYVVGHAARRWTIR